MFTVLAVSIGIMACGMFGMDLQDGPQKEVLKEVAENDTELSDRKSGKKLRI